MAITICYGPVVDGAIDANRCFERPAIKYTKTMPDPDNAGENMDVIKYEIKEGDEGFSSVELNTVEAEDLAQRLCVTTQASKGGNWDWRIMQ